MPDSVIPPPISAIEPVTEIYHGVEVSDHYRWLEDQDSDRTRAWIDEQTRYLGSYLEQVAGRGRIRERIRELLDVETYDSFLKTAGVYFFRKRPVGKEQPAIYMRRGVGGPDELLIDPAARGTGSYTAVRPVRASWSGRFLLYEVKQGGERTGSFEILDVATRTVLPEGLARGYLRGFAFAWDEKGFYYVHEPLRVGPGSALTAFCHIFGTDRTTDAAVFSVEQSASSRLCVIAGENRLGFLVTKLLDRARTSFYLKRLEREGAAACLMAEQECSFGPALVGERLFGITNHSAPNFRIVELRLKHNGEVEWISVVPETDSRIQDWIVTSDRILVSYLRKTTLCVSVYDHEGKKHGDWPARFKRTLRFIAASVDDDDVVIETESFTEPPAAIVCSVKSNQFVLWSQRKVPFHSARCSSTQVWYTSTDGTRIPMFLMGRREVVKGGCHRVIMTSYGGFGIAMTPQFSVFVSFLVERGWLFALPNIRGGSELGTAWHDAAKRTKRQTAYDDFLAAAEWLIANGKTTPSRLAIFGGSNSGLLAGVALTQRPELFRAAVLMVPLLDMLRYHRFDGAHMWREEFGTADDPNDFAALMGYSPYHHVRDDVRYPAALIVSGDQDQNCNGLHARKMTARLQATPSSGPILLDYSPFRGHSPVLPLSERIEALTRRMAFLCDQLELAA